MGGVAVLVPQLCPVVECEQYGVVVPPVGCRRGKEISDSDGGARGPKLVDNFVDDVQGVGEGDDLRGVG